MVMDKRHVTVYKSMHDHGLCVYLVVVNMSCLYVDLWGPADEPTLMDKNSPLAGLLSSPLQLSVASALWRVGQAGTSTESGDPG